MSLNFIPKAVGNNKRDLSEEMEPIESEFFILLVWRMEASKIGSKKIS